MPWLVRTENNFVLGLECTDLGLKKARTFRAYTVDS